MMNGGATEEVNNFKYDGSIHGFILCQHGRRDTKTVFAREESGRILSAQ